MAVSMTFTKLFSSITESTIWVAPDAHRICWIAMLAMADRQGRVWASVPGLASRARISVEDARSALESFMAPDADSRTKDHEGRRIEEIDGGWRLLNHKKYREIRDEEAILEAKRKYINTRRAVEAVENVDRGRHNAEAEADTELKPKSKVAPLALPGWLDEELWQSYIKLRPAKARTPDSLKAALAKLEKFRESGYDANAIVANSLSNGWQGLFPPDQKRGAQQTPAKASIPCASCKTPLTGAWTQSPAGRVCNPCWRAYRDGTVKAIK